MTEQDYNMVWMIYLGAAAVAFLTGWWLTRRWVTWISYPLRAVAFAVLFTPWGIMRGGDYMAPAWAVTAFDGLVIANGEPLRAGAPLIAAIILALIVATLLWGARLFALSRLQHHDDVEDDEE